MGRQSAFAPTARLVKLLALVALLLAWALPASAQYEAAGQPNAKSTIPPKQQPGNQATRDPATADLAAEAAAEAAKRQAVQPGNNAPVWREVRQNLGARASVPGREMNVLVQTEGQEWRAWRNGFWSVIAGWLLVGTLAVLAIAYVLMGTSHLHQPETGRKILRFTQVERWVHWTVAVTFSILAISGLIMLFGKNILLPIIGYTLFSGLASISKNLHNFLGPLFTVCILVMVVTYARHNWPRLRDVEWLVKLGGLFSKSEVPSGKFNAGEKLWFWGGALFLGTIVSISGLVLDFPNFDQTRSTMQLANIVHLVSTGLFMALGLGHIYMGTLGVGGAYQGMKTGYVDEEWAREHHRYWYEDIKSGKVGPRTDPAHRVAGEPASGPAD